MYDCSVQYAFLTHKFTGKERDAESGLDNFGKRYHASSLGRFMTPDPIMIMKQKLRDPQQWNMYSYTRNNPVTFTDPTGAYTCQGNKDQCAQIKAGYDAAQKALAAAKPKSEQAKQLKSVLDFVGAPGKANGVAVTFGKLDTGTPAQTSTETTRDLLGTSHNNHVRFATVEPRCQTDFWASLGALGERHRSRSDA
jgi:RHS repeat-associated protein